MTPLLCMILTMSLAGSLLAVIMMTGERFWGRRMRYVWQYYLWLIVVIRLLVPGGFFIERPEGTAGREMPALTRAADVPAAAGAPETAPDAEQSAAAGPEPAAAEPDSAPAWRPAVADVLALIWAGGALILFVQRLTAYRSYLRCLRAGLEPCADARLLDLTAELAGRLGIRRPVEVAVNPLASSPMLIGWRCPCIVLPEVPPAQSAFTCTVLHELVHWKRCDHLYKWAAQIAVCVHWFNPLVWMMSRRIARLCELACDERVMRILGGGEEASYGATLLDSMAGARSCHAAAGTLELSENKRLLKERLERMEEHVKKKPGGAVLLALLSACLLLCAACTRVYVPLPALSRIPDVLPQQSGDTAVWSQAEADLEIYADSAWLDVQTTEDSVVRADFDRSCYSVDIEEAAGKTTVNCIGLVQADPRHMDRRITLYIPANGIRNVTTELYESLQTGCAQVAEQSYRIRSGALETQVPETVRRLDISAENSMVRLLGDDDFSRTEVQLEMHKSMLLTSDSLRSRVERSGESALLPCADAAVRVEISADNGVVMLNAYKEITLRELADRWSAYGAGSVQAEGELLPAAPTMSAEDPDAAVRTEDPASGETAGAAAREDGVIRGVFSEVREGVGSVLSEVREGVGSIMKEVGSEVRSELHSALADAA